MNQVAQRTLRRTGSSGHSNEGAPLRGCSRLVAVGCPTSDRSLRLAAPLVEHDQQSAVLHRSMGGTAAIFAHNAAMLGGSVAFAGPVADDDGGHFALSVLRAAGVDIILTTLAPFTSEVIVIVGPDGDRTMIAACSRVEWPSHLPVGPNDLVFFEGWPLFDNAERPSFVALVRSTKALGASIAIDVCSAARIIDPSRYRSLLASLGVDILFANDSEARKLNLDAETIAPLTVVHADSRPTRVYDGNNKFTIPLTPVVPFDATGAGDTFAAGFLVSFLAGRSITESVIDAHEAAASVLATPGALLDPIRPNMNMKVSA
jgi:sugar/nucleoside kinase (ribokinase family)